MHSRRPCMDNTFRNALVIEMKDFFAQDEIFQQCGSARIRPERVLIIRKHDALIGGERGMLATGNLVKLAAGGRLRLSVGRCRTFFLFALFGFISRLVFTPVRSPLFI